MACAAVAGYMSSAERKTSASAGFWEWLNTWINPLGFFSRIGHEEEMRLSCQTKVYGDCKVEARPDLNLHGEKFWS